MSHKFSVFVPDEILKDVLRAAQSLAAQGRRGVPGDPIPTKNGAAAAWIVSHLHEFQALVETARRSKIETRKLPRRDLYDDLMNANPTGFLSMAAAATVGTAAGSLISHKLRGRSLPALGAGLARARTGREAAWESRSNPQDDEIRRLEKAARTGDPRAAERLRRMAARSGRPSVMPRWAKKIPKNFACRTCKRPPGAGMTIYVSQMNDDEDAVRRGGQEAQVLLTGCERCAAQDRYVQGSTWENSGGRTWCRAADGKSDPATASRAAYAILDGLEFDVARRLRDAGYVVRHDPRYNPLKKGAHSRARKHPGVAAHRGFQAAQASRVYDVGEPDDYISPEHLAISPEDQARYYGQILYPSYGGVAAGEQLSRHRASRFPEANPSGCRRCRGAQQVKLGPRMVACPTCCRKNPLTRPESNEILLRAAQTARVGAREKRLGWASGPTGLGRAAGMAEVVEHYGATGGHSAAARRIARKAGDRLGHGYPGEGQSRKTDMTWDERFGVTEAGGTIMPYPAHPAGNPSTKTPKIRKPRAPHKVGCRCIMCPAGAHRRAAPFGSPGRPGGRGGR